MIKEEDLDLLTLLTKVCNDTPRGGLKGDFGLGGAAGKGGKGGSSCTAYDGNRMINNPGGANGPNGVAGHNGK